MQTPTTEPAEPRPAPPAMAEAQARPEPCPNRATCKSPTCKGLRAGPRDGALTMPIMDVRYPAGRLDAAGRQALAERLTDVMIGMEGGANTEGGRTFATVLFTEVPAGFCFVGGRADQTHVSSSGAFLVHVSIPEGYMDQARKSGVQVDVTAAIAATIGVAATGAHSVQVIVDEVTEGNWAAGGRTISIARIADTVGLAKSGDRFAWSAPTSPPRPAPSPPPATPRALAACSRTPTGTAGAQG